MSMTSGPAVGGQDRQLDRLAVEGQRRGLGLVAGVRHRSRPSLERPRACGPRVVWKIRPPGGSTVAAGQIRPASVRRATVSSRPRTSIMSKTLGVAVRPASAARRGGGELAELHAVWPRPRASRMPSSAVARPASILQVRRQFVQYTTGYRIERSRRRLVGLNRARWPERSAPFRADPARSAPGP